MESGAEESRELVVIKSSSSSSSSSNSMVSATVGRVMNTLLSAKSKKLQDAISRLDSPPKIAPLGVSLEQSLRFLHKYVAEAAEKEETMEESLDQVLVPMIEHCLKLRESKQCNQAMVLLNWLFQDDVQFQVLARALAGIILRKEDHYIALGWCTLTCSLIDYETTMGTLIANGIRERYTMLLKILCSCVRYVIPIICSGSILQGAYELPTRLSVAAADFVLYLTVALTRNDLQPGISESKQKSFNLSRKRQPVTLVSAATIEANMNTATESFSDNLDIKMLIWDCLDELMVLLRKLIAWNKKSRPLHSVGSERVLKWLQSTKQYYGCLQNEADSKMLRSGALLLSSCWKHYGMLLCLEDYKFLQQYRELLDQYLAGIQFYTENHAEKSVADEDSGIETAKFFLNCLSLLLGRLDVKRFEAAVLEFGDQTTQVLMSLLHCVDEEVVDITICIFKAVIFKTNRSSSKSTLADIRQMDTVLPLLFNLLDERDGAAKAAVKLIAEYCSISSDSHCLQEVLKRLGSKDVLPRRNAMDVISELIHMKPEAYDALSPDLWQDIASHLLERLGDDDSVIAIEASNLIAVIRPAFVLPSLVCLIYSPHESIQSSSKNAFLKILKNHEPQADLVCMLLDSLSNLCQGPTLPAAVGVTKEGTKLDIDKVLKLLPEWMKMVEDWDLMIGQLIDKMFAEPSNAVIVRFLSYISEHLAEHAHLVFHRLLLHTKGQKVSLDESFSMSGSRTYADNDTAKWEHFLFNRLCPLLIVKVLPLRAFDNLHCCHLYGELATEQSISDDGSFNITVTENVAALLINRALNKFEYDDVRRLAAELCGRLHPQVLIPIMSFQMENAVHSEDTMKIKACLYSICGSLLVRGMDSYQHPNMLSIRKTIETILLWPSVDGDDVSKAQHGCIDCLALMLCTELQALKTSKDAAPTRVAAESSVVTFVIHHLTRDKSDFVSPRQDVINSKYLKTTLSFRLCMANVLIIACQKIADNGKKAFVNKILPSVLNSLNGIEESEIRAACIQVLFSSVYHLKRGVLAYASDILEVAVLSLRQGTQKERLAGAKLLVSLLASEEAIVESVSGRLLEARALLTSISLSDPSLDVREVCQKLLACLTPS